MSSVAISKKYERLLANYDKHCQRIAKATTIDINEPIADKLNRIKWLQEDYARWFEYYFPNYAKVKCSWYQKAAAKLLIDNPQLYLLFEVFRSGGKSVHINMGIPLFLYFTGRLKYMVLIGQTDPKAKRLLAGIMSQLRHNQRLLNDYGSRFKYGDWADGDFSTTDGARFRSFGFGQSPRGEQEEGMRPDYISVDDADIKKHLQNDRIMGEREDFIFEDLIGCFDAADNATRRFVYANNNFHKKSLTNRMKDRFKKAITKSIARHQQERSGERKERHNVPFSKYQILSVPAVKDLVNFESNWPEKTSAKFWRDLYHENGHRSFCREYMHIHVEEGKIFKVENMQWKTMYPYSAYQGLAFYGDLSYKTAGDFKAMILVGKRGKELHIIHTFLRQVSRAEVAAWLYDLYEERNLGNYNITYKIEGLFAQDEFEQDFDLEGDERGYHIPVIADKRGKEGKYDRIASTEGYFQRRWVYFNEAERNNADQIELLDQYYAFERGSEAHDDGPDAVHGGFSEVNRSAHINTFDVRIGMIGDEVNPNTF